MAARSVLASMARPRSRSGNSSRAAAMRAEEVSSNGVAAASAAEGAKRLFMGRCPGERGTGRAAGVLSLRPLSSNLFRPNSHSTDADTEKAPDREVGRFEDQPK